MALYLITGIAGFIGSSIARALVSRGEQVRGVDNFATGKHENLADILDRIDFRERIALLGAEGAAGVDFSKLVAWGAAAPVLASQGARWLVAGAALLTVTTLLGWYFFETGPILFLAALALEVSLAVRLRARARWAQRRRVRGRRRGPSRLVSSSSWSFFLCG